MSSARGFSIAFARDMIPEKMKPYSSSLPPIYEKYEGRYLAIGGQGRGVDWLCGDWADRMVMVGEFPSFEAVGAFWWGPEYRASAKFREGAVTVDVCQVPGTDVAPKPEHSVFLLIAVSADAPMAYPSGDTIIAAGPGDIAVLEGNLSGLSLTMIGFPSRDALDAAWAEIVDEVKAADGYACAANRAPSK